MTARRFKRGGGERDIRYHRPSFGGYTSKKIIVDTYHCFTVTYVTCHSKFWCFDNSIMKKKAALDLISVRETYARHQLSVSQELQRNCLAMNTII